MPIAITPDQLAMQASIRDWAKQAGPVAAVRRLEPDPAGPAQNTYLSDLADLGIFSISIPAEAGGAGGTVTDLAAALEQLTIALVPGPVTPNVLAGLLLTAAGSPLLPALAAGQATGAVGLTAGTLTGTRAADGTLHVTGQAGPVLGAGTTSHLLLGCTTDEGEAWFQLEAGCPGLTVTSRPPVDFSRSLADVSLAGAVIAADQVLAGLDRARVRDLAATLFAAEAAGVAAWCSETAAGYAGIRRQFGHPIGSFQAVKHLCATMACRAERAAALAWDAARTADEAPSEHPFAAAAAAALALDDAVDNAKDCIQVLGGIGFTWEHDAHLYLRRALALRQLLGGSRLWRERLAAIGPRRQAQAQPQPESPYPGIGAWAGPAIEKYGSQAQQQRFLGPTRRAEITWCQLFSEPEAGSDLASLRTRAERTEAGWRLDRPEGVDVPGPPGRLGHLPGPHRPRRAQAPGDQLLPGRHARPRHRHPAAARDHRPHHVQRGLPGRRVRAGRLPARRPRRGLADRHVHAVRRAGGDRYRAGSDLPGHRPGLFRTGRVSRGLRTRRRPAG